MLARVRATQRDVSLLVMTLQQDDPTLRPILDALRTPSRNPPGIVRNDTLGADDLLWYTGAPDEHELAVPRALKVAVVADILRTWPSWRGKH